MVTQTWTLHTFLHYDLGISRLYLYKFDFFITLLISFHPSPPYPFLSFPNQIQIEDVENEEKRYTLFLELLEAAQKWEDFQMLMLLLQAWPPMMKEEV